MKTSLEHNEHTYGSRRLSESLLQSMLANGLDPDHLTTKDLVTFDELHVMGREATIALGRLAGLKEHMRVLDIGSGLGGPARTLAENFGCHVTGVDLSAEFVQAGIALSRRVGLGPMVTFQQEDALNLTFDDGRFDVVVMIHLNMNIVDKAALFREAVRVIAPGGRLVLWEICAGDNGPVIYPVPWADSSVYSHLVSMQELADHLRRAGLETLHVEDASRESIEWVEARMAAMKRKRTPKPGPDRSLILKDFRIKRSNISKNLLNGTIRIVRMMGTK